MKPLEVCPHCGKQIDNRVDSKKDKVAAMQKKLKETWEENKKSYMKKYPQRDYELQLDSMLDWINREWTRAERRAGDWNLFIQNWLSTSRKSFDLTSGTTEVRANLHKDNASITEYLFLGKKRGVFEKSEKETDPYVLKTYASGYKINVKEKW